MSDCPENKLIRQREGTTQQKRYKNSLDPKNIQLMGFGVKDWMNFAQKFATNINFFEEDDYKNPQGNWEPFHNATNELKKIVETYNEGEINPQLALFISFLKLLNLSKKRFNEITKRHLDFYYKEVLQLKNKEAQADNVYLIFELAKNATTQLLQKETLVNGGKDSEGNKRNYGLVEEIVINKATIAAIKSTYIDSKGWYASPIANSGDGEGGAIENDKNSWLPFGDATRSLAKKGFSIAAPSLKLTEGPRNIDLKITFDNFNSEFRNRNDLQGILKVEHTGEKEWVDITEKLLKIETDNNTLTLKLSLDESADTIENYNKEIHKGNYQTEHPLLRIIFDAEVQKKALSFKFYKQLVSRTLKNITLNTTATYSSKIELSNDLGKINLDNPFYPFGPQAKKNAKLKIGAKEWVGKRISDVKLALKWKDVPENLENHYEHYKQELVNFNTTVKTVITNSNFGNYNSLVTGTYGQNRFTVDLGYIENDRTIITTNQSNSQTAAQGGFSQKEISQRLFSFDRIKDFALLEERLNTDAISNFVQNDSKEEITNEQLFSNTEYKEFKSFLPSGTPYTLKPTDDYFIQLSLKNNFLHNAYAKIYTYLALNKLSLPNEAYTPFVEKIKVTITTEEIISSSQNTVTLFHEHPFGTSKTDANSSNFKIVPNPETGGHLFIGFDKTEEDQNVQVLFQIEEGSENPDSITNQKTLENTTFKTGAKEIIWQYLKKDKWQNLKPNFLLKDETDNFLKTGLVKFTIPKESKNNNLFAEDYFWLQAKIANKFDSVSKIVHIHAQAVDAKFINNTNTLEHLDNGLEPKTISKLETRLATIKKLEQPYTSFNGIPKENDLDYYRRVSEILRHKNRAITVWDYEHLILQEFTYLHKIKCLNHSIKNSFIAPGNVLLVAVPNIINQNVYNIYQPKLSQAKLNSIKTYINKLNTLHVDAEVISPNYEPIQIDLKVVFREGFDANFYTKQLQLDIAAYLSPWAFDKNQPISFGNAMYHSEVIYFIENLEYVDYIKDFKMTHNRETKKEIIPTDQKSVLTTVEPTLHKVTAITTSLCQ